MMKKKALLMGCLLGAIMPMGAAAQDEVVCSFNPANVILPSSQYTPDRPYTADVWVYDTGQRYSDQYHNKVWAVPDDDAAGRKWYEPDYELTDNTVAWKQGARAPFSSDEYYKGQPSYRWNMGEIMGEMYMRRTFTLDGPAPGAVYLACGHDDAPAEWYINGVQVLTVDDGWNNDKYVLLTDGQKELLRTDGTENVIALHVHQNWGGAFADCGLYAADMTYVHNYLPTVASGDWECKYYLLNYDTDIKVAETAKWAAVDEDESDWIPGYGPFSLDRNMFYTTPWPSRVRPILIRRHFTLTEAELEEAMAGDVVLSCSYDENPRVFLNGRLIWSAQKWNDNDYVQVKLTAVQKRQLVAGDNVLAVSLTSGDGGGHIDYGLGLLRHAPTPVDSPAAGAAGEADSRVYDLGGHCLGTGTDGLRKGVYIVGGKKYVVGK